MTLIKNHIDISDVWLKASILGATWAASEIILGSFLHNLRVPFNGNILTAIGLILMISASYTWKDKGLFWRTGLICALMKTLSPSAIIFGPMIAIMMEAVLLEVSVRTLGRNVLGFLVGASLAMSWILVQKIVNFILFYGKNIVEIYTELMLFASRQLKTDFDLVWLPLVILLGLYIIFGLVAVVIGMKIGKKLQNKTDFTWERSSENQFDFLPKKNAEFPYSLPWLFFNFAVLITMLFVITNTALYIWIPSTFIVLLIWTSRYKRGLKQLSKPKFWTLFILITMLTAFVITSIDGKNHHWTAGFLIGLQMNFRAALVIVGFSVIGQELFNPRIRRFFAKTSFKQLPVALEFAFDSFPNILKNLPDIKSIFKNPMGIIQTMVAQSEQRFKEVKQGLNRKIYILSDQKDSGKTTFIKNNIQKLKEQNIAIDGFYAEKIYQNDVHIGYDLVHVTDLEQIPFLQLKGQQNTQEIGRFSVKAEAIKKATQWLQKTEIREKNLIIIDEIGKWELEGKGWSTLVDYLINHTQISLLLVIREVYVNDVITHFKLKNVYPFTLDNWEDSIFKKEFL